MFSNGVIVAGTDTGVGKTFVAAGLLCALRRNGANALPMKPVQTGAAADGRAPDLDFCLATAGIDADPILYDQLAPYRFPLAASPHLAAREAGVEIDAERILQAYSGLRGAGNILVVEAAGGLLVPLTDHLLQIDLLARLRLPVALVARARLGTLNHTLLSVEALRARGIAIACVYLNAAESGWGIIERDNERTLARILRGIAIHRIERVDPPTPHAAARLFSAAGA